MGINFLTNHAAGRGHYMGHKTGSLVFQVQERLSSITRYGESKHAAKENKEYTQFIYSYKTFKNYLDSCSHFVKYCKAHYHCKTLEDCKPYINQYLQDYKKGESAWTIKAVSSALAKLYGISSKDFDKTPARHRADIKRSRGKAKQDKHFSERKNADLMCARVPRDRKNSAETAGSEEKLQIRRADVGQRICSRH